MPSLHPRKGVSAFISHIYSVVKLRLLLLREGRRVSGSLGTYYMPDVSHIFSTTF